MRDINEKLVYSDVGTHNGSYFKDCANSTSLNSNLVISQPYNPIIVVSPKGEGKQ